MRGIINKISRKFTQLRLQPIRVFCFHQVSEIFDPDVYCKPDWVPTSYLKQFIEDLQKDGYEFISLVDAYSYIKKDIVRCKKYAVLTADDGLKCQLDFVPWLEEHNVPITLFVNVETLNGDVCGKPMKEHFQIECKEEEMRHAKQLYIERKDLKMVSDIVSIGMHGVNHNEVTHMSDEEFRRVVEECKDKIGLFEKYIPFYAYTFGKYAFNTDAILHSANVVPVLTDGLKNYDDLNYVHREVIEKKYKEKNRYV